MIKKILLGLVCLALTACNSTKPTEAGSVQPGTSSTITESNHEHEFVEDYIIPATLTETSKMCYKCSCGETKVEDFGIWCPKTTIEQVASAILGYEVVEDEDYFKQATVYGIELTCGGYSVTNTKFTVLDYLSTFAPTEYELLNSTDEDGNYFHYTAKFKYEENVYLGFMTYIDSETDTINGRIETYIS